MVKFRPLSRLSWLAALMFIATSPPARAQVVEEVQEEEMVVQQAQVMTLNDNIIDQWVFNGVGNNNNPRDRFETLLKLQVADVGRTCGATEAQAKKLELAGRGDIHRFFEGIEEIKRKHTPLRNEPNFVNAAFQEIQPLRTVLNPGPFGEGSLFLKTLRKTLNEEQAARYTTVLRERKMFRHRARIDLIVKQFDNSLGLNAAQRERFTKLLQERTRPPKVSGPYETQFVLLQLARLPEDQVKPLFDDAQWRLLNHSFDQARSMEVFLNRNGYVRDDAR